MSEEHKKYRKVRIAHGASGWGGPLIIEPKPGRDIIYSCVPGGIHPVAKKIAELTGGTPYDGFVSRVAWDQMAVAVIDCAGTARVAVYPMKGVLTVNTKPNQPSGPAFWQIKKELFVSGIRLEDVALIED